MQVCPECPCGGSGLQQIRGAEYSLFWQLKPLNSFNSKQPKLDMVAMPVILSSKRLKQEDSKFEGSLSYIVRVFQKQINKAYKGSSFENESPWAHLLCS